MSKRHNSRCCPKNHSILLFFFNKPILQLECMNFRMFLPLYSIKRMENFYVETVIVVLCNVITFHLRVLVFSLLSFVINPSILIRILIYRLQMWIKMKNGAFKINNNEENIINPANLLSLRSTSLSSQGVDHKDRRLTRLITFSLLLLILYCILIHIWSL